MNKILVGCALFLSLTAASAWAGAIHSGTVKKTMNSGGYTYMLVDEGNSDVWVALPETSLKVGQKVSYLKGSLMSNFTSKSLNKTFEHITFSTGLTDEKMAEASAKTDAFSTAIAAEKDADEMLADGNSPGSEGAVTTFQALKVDKATGDNSYRIAELYADRKAFAGKTVRVRGKAVKVNEAIMGKNWVHLQDGTGNPMKNSHDLVVTTTEKVKEGEVVTISGTVAMDRDFGYSYKYDLLLEEGEIVK